MLKHYLNVLALHEFKLENNFFQYDEYITANSRGWEDETKLQSDSTKVFLEIVKK